MSLDFWPESRTILEDIIKTIKLKFLLSMFADFPLIYIYMYIKYVQEVLTQFIL